MSAPISESPASSTSTATPASGWKSRLPYRMRTRPRSFGTGKFGIDKFDSRDDTRYAWTRLAPPVLGFLVALMSMTAPAFATNPYCESADGTTTNYGFCKPAVDVEGANRWGDKYNSDQDSKDSTMKTLSDTLAAGATTFVHAAGDTMKGSLVFTGPSPWVDVSASTFGATCLGVVDDAAAANRAINYAASVRGNVLIPCACDLGILSPLYISTPSVHLQMCGKLGGSRITKLAGFVGPAAVVMSGQNSSITDGYITAASSNTNTGDGLQLRGNHVAARNMYVARMGGNGVRQGCDSPADCHSQNEIELDNVEAQFNGGGGFYVSDDSGTKNTENDNASLCTHCASSGNTGDGFFFGKTFGYTCVNCLIEQNHGVGIHVSSDASKITFYGGDSENNNLDRLYDPSAVENVLIDTGTGQAVAIYGTQIGFGTSVKNYDYSTDSGTVIVTEGYSSFHNGNTLNNLTKGVINANGILVSSGSRSGGGGLCFSGDPTTCISKNANAGQTVFSGLGQVGMILTAGPTIPPNLQIGGGSLGQAVIYARTTSGQTTPAYTAGGDTQSGITNVGTNQGDWIGTSSGTKNFEWGGALGTGHPETLYFDHYSTVTVQGVNSSGVSLQTSSGIVSGSSMTAQAFVTQVLGTTNLAVAPGDLSYLSYLSAGVTTTTCTGCGDVSFSTRTFPAIATVLWKQGTMVTVDCGYWLSGSGAAKTVGIKYSNPSSGARTSLLGISRTNSSANCHAHIELTWQAHALWTVEGSDICGSGAGSSSSSQISNGIATFDESAGLPIVCTGTAATNNGDISWLDQRMGFRPVAVAQ